MTAHFMALPWPSRSPALIRKMPTRRKTVARPLRPATARERSSVVEAMPQQKGFYGKSQPFPTPEPPPTRN